MIFHVVDDQEIICEFIDSILCEAGHQVCLFNSTREYLNFLQSEEYVRPTALFTDLDMPLLGGGELIKEVRARYPDQKCVIVSGSLDLKWQCETCNCIPLGKPFSVEQLEAMADSFQEDS